MRLRRSPHLPEAFPEPPPTGSHAARGRGGGRARALRKPRPDAALGITRARAGAVSDEETVALWRALVAGEWTIVDRFESDGRRYLVARPNEHATRGAAALSAREEQVARAVAAGHSNKLIAYELGVAESTVSTLVARAAGKLGASSRVDLVRVMRARADADAAE